MTASQLEAYYRSKTVLFDREVRRFQWYNNIIVYLPGLFSSAGDPYTAWQVLGRFLRPSDRVDAVEVMLSLSGDTPERSQLRRLYIDSVESLSAGNRAIEYQHLLGEHSRGSDELMEALDALSNPVQRVHGLVSAIARGEAPEPLWVLVRNELHALESDESVVGGVVPHELSGVLARFVDDIESYAQRIFDLDVTSSGNVDRFSWTSSFLEEAWDWLPGSVRSEGIGRLNDLVSQEPDAEWRQETAAEVEALQAFGRTETLKPTAPVDRARSLLRSVGSDEVLRRAGTAYRRLNLIALSELCSTRSVSFTCAQVEEDLLEGVSEHVSVEDAGVPDVPGSPGSILPSLVDEILSSMERLSLRSPQWFDEPESLSVPVDIIERDVPTMPLAEALSLISTIYSDPVRYRLVYRASVDRRLDPRDRLRYLHLMGSYFTTQTLFEVGEELVNAGDSEGWSIIESGFSTTDWFSGCGSSKTCSRIVRESYERVFDELLADADTGSV